MNIEPAVFNKLILSVSVVSAGIGAFVAGISNF